MTRLLRRAVRAAADWALSWADYWTGAARHPRMTLLEWGHRPPSGGAVYVALGACVVLGIDLPPRWAVVALGIVAGPSVALSLAGLSAHAAWRRGWVLRGVECPCCAEDDDGPDDGPDDDAPDDGPDDPGGYGLTPADAAFLRSLSAALTLETTR